MSKESIRVSSLVMATFEGVRQVLANIEKIDVFSGHGDRDDLMEFVTAQSPETLKRIFLVHGEYESMEAFRDTLAEAGYPQVVIPKKGERFEL